MLPLGFYSRVKKVDLKYQKNKQVLTSSPSLVMTWLCQASSAGHYRGYPDINLILHR